MITLNGHEVKVGDRLWSVFHGQFGEVVHAETWPIIVKVDHAYSYFTESGSYFQDGPQLIFWDKVEIIPPPKPKRKVKKWPS